MWSEKQWKQQNGRMGYHAYHAQVFLPKLHTNTMANEQKIGSKSAQSINMWAEWAYTMEDGVP